MQKHISKLPTIVDSNSSSLSVPSSSHRYTHRKKLLIDPAIRTLESSIMKIQKPLLIGLAASSASAHHVLTSFLVNDERQYDVLRQPGTVSPILDPNSANLACGFPPGDGQGAKGTAKATIKPSSKLTFGWHTNWSGDTPGPDGVTDVSHKGPCAIYMRKVANSVSAIAEDPGSPGWFKIWEDGVDDRGVFCTTRMRENGGFFSGTVPKGLEEGDYLIRAETITLNNAAEPRNEPQWYVGCAQVTLTSSPPPSVSPPTIRIPSGDYANLNMPGLRYNIWYPVRDSYPDYGPVPGPAVFNGSSENAGTPRPVPPANNNEGSGRIGDGTTKVPGSNGPSSTANTQESTTSLPDGFSTIPWPLSSQQQPMTATITMTTAVKSTSTSTITITSIRPTTATSVKSATDDTMKTKTVYVTATHTATHSHRHRHGHGHGRGHGHPHSKTVTITRTVSQTTYISESTTAMPTGEPTRDTTTTPTSTNNYITAIPTGDTTITPTSTNNYITAIPTGEINDASTTTASLSARHIHHIHPYQYRHWHRGHVGMRRRI
ncbi:hypothetical protein TWF696_007535 [Orbilia brochopaga]|uniref:AA9 family lytic polysaccharide monooxygenase n=1 Tax=Orbilia brochopaga TaxID=3140254 RepID=A0AAV9URL9_9PEZI